MTEANRTEAQINLDALLASIRGLVTEAGLTAPVASPEEGARALLAEVRRLKPLADDGVRFKQETIDNAIASGVRAFGSTGETAFKVEEYKSTFAALPIDAIRSMGEGWESIAKAKIPTGRATTDDAGDPEDERNRTPAKTSPVMDGLFAS